MGRSAKVHKRVKAKESSKPSHPAEPASVDPKAKAKLQQQDSVHSQKNKQRKARAALEDLRHGKGGHVLAGVDYLQLAHGGRRKAQEEAAKMARLKAEGDALLNADALGNMQL